MSEQKRPPGRPPKSPSPCAPEQPQEAKSPSKKDKYQLAVERRRKHEQKRKKTGALEGQQLVAPKRPGYIRRWVNDEPGRIDNLYDRGYDFVEDDDSAIPSTNEGSRKSQVVGTGKDGQPLKAYLMEIPEDLYQEDQERKEREIREVEDQVRNAQHGQDRSIGSEPDKVYRPGDSQLLDEG